MQWRASDVWCTMFLTIFLLFFGLVDSEKEDACSARCLRLHQRSIQRIDLSSDSLKALLEKKEPREQLKDTCWRTYDYFDCMKHCDHVPIEFEKFQRYVTKQCKEVMTDMDSSLRCVSKYHFFIEFRCSSFMKEAIRLRERIGRQYTPDEETCRYLHLNALCLETAVVKHCPEAKKIFRRLNFRDYFLNFILPEDDATFDDQDLDSCQVYDFVKKAMVLPTSTEEVYASTLPWSSTEELFSPSVTTEEIEADTTTLMDTTTSIDTTTTLIEEELQKLKEKQSIVPDEQLRNETEADEEIQTIDRELALLDQNIAHDDMTNMEKNLRELTSTEQSGEKEKDTIDIRPSTLRVSSDSHTTDTTSPVTDTEPTTLNRSIRSTTPKQRTTSPRRITVHRKTKLTRLPDGSIRTTTNDKEELAFTTSAGVVGELMSASIMSSTQKSVPPVLHAPTLSDELMDDLDPELLLPSNEKWWDNDSDEEKKKEKAREKEEHTTAREIDLPTSRPVRILHSETSTPILIEKEGDHFGADILLLPPANHEDRADDVTATIQSITPASTLSIDEELESTIEQLFATPAEQKTSTQPTKTKNAKFFDEVITSTTVLTSTTSESSITPMDKGVMELENLEPEETSSYKEITVPTESSRRKLFSSDEDFDITPNFHYSTYKIGLIPHDRDRYTYQPMETTTSDNSHTTSLAVSSEIEETTSLTPTKVMKKHKDKKEKKERKNKKNKNSREQLENKSTEIFIPKETQSRNGIPTSTTIVVASRESDSEVVSSSPTKTGTSMDATTTSQTTFLRPNRIFVKQILPKHALYVDDNPEHDATTQEASKVYLENRKQEIDPVLDLPADYEYVPESSTEGLEGIGSAVTRRLGQEAHSAEEEEARPIRDDGRTLAMVYGALVVVTLLTVLCILVLCLCKKIRPGRAQTYKVEQ